MNWHTGNTQLSLHRDCICTIKHGWLFHLEIVNQTVYICTYITVMIPVTWSSNTTLSKIRTAISCHNHSLESRGSIKLRHVRGNNRLEGACALRPSTFVCGSILLWNTCLDYNRLSHFILNEVQTLSEFKIGLIVVERERWLILSELLAPWKDFYLIIELYSGSIQLLG